MRRSRRKSNEVNYTPNHIIANRVVNAVLDLNNGPWRHAGPAVSVKLEVAQELDSEGKRLVQADVKLRSRQVTTTSSTMLLFVMHIQVLEYGRLECKFTCGELLNDDDTWCGTLVETMAGRYELLNFHYEPLRR